MHAAKVIPFDIAAILDGDEAIAENLSPVIVDGYSEESIGALRHTAKARGMRELTEKSRRIGEQLAPRSGK